MTCPVCFHSNYSSPALDDMEAACGCGCHDEPITDDYDIEDDEWIDDQREKE